MFFPTSFQPLTGTRWRAARELLLRVGRGGVHWAFRLGPERPRDGSCTEEISHLVRRSGFREDVGRCPQRGAGPTLRSGPSAGRVRTMRPSRPPHALMTASGIFAMRITPLWGALTWLGHMSNRCDLLLARGLIRDGPAGAPQRDKASMVSGSSSTRVRSLSTGSKRRKCYSRLDGCARCSHSHASASQRRRRSRSLSTRLTCFCYPP